MYHRSLEQGEQDRGGGESERERERGGGGGGGGESLSCFIQLKIIFKSS
jgi:hypothetical protein